MAKQPKSWPHKVRPVRIAEMRVPAAGIAQRRFSQSQAEEYASNLDPNKLGIPAVNLRNSIYWIVDGQHRVAALKIFFAPSDPGSLDCSVYEDLSDADMAELFIGLNTRRAVNRFDLFKVSCTAERSRESDVQRVVEANGLKVVRTSQPDGISAVSALCQVADRAGTTVLGQALRVLRDGLGASTGARTSVTLRRRSRRASGVPARFSVARNRSASAQAITKRSAFRRSASISTTRRCTLALKIVSLPGGKKPSNADHGFGGWRD